MDIQKEPFTVCAIGDMSGDVFGNGMLLSKATKMVAAFNHLHIFVDPRTGYRPKATANASGCSICRARAGWITTVRRSAKAAALFDRSARAIRLSPQMRALLDIQGESASGEEIVRRILTAPVDLLYNGGIGTYVKASNETDADVGDRTNDRVRVNATEVRARVVGEGGNRGFTQMGRIEYWMRGGLINTDALDNSGGVDTSDHEVNLKILLDVLVKKGIVKSKEERNRILAEMAEEVAALVLADNENQSRALSLDALRSAAHYEEFVDVDRRDDPEAAHRPHQRADPLPRDAAGERSEIARSAASRAVRIFWGTPRCGATMRSCVAAFRTARWRNRSWTGISPNAMRRDFSRNFEEHPLRREIIVTAVINYVVNNGGVALLVAPDGIRQKRGGCDCGVPRSRPQVGRAGTEATHAGGGPCGRRRTRSPTKNRGRPGGRLLTVFFHMWVGASALDTRLHLSALFFMWVGA